MSLIFAILGLSFLVFIHELGHYLMAKKEKMKVEAFSIGFGPKLFAWKRGETEWRICLLPFGGYVKIAGMQQEDDADLRKVEGGFFAQSPWSRIKVAFMGPLANIVFAFAAFTLIWAIGGKPQPFQSVTKKIGWVDPDSALYKDGLRPGDEVLTMNQKKVGGYQDFYTKLLMEAEPVSLGGYKIDYTEGDKVPFSYKISLKDPDNVIQEKMQLLSPAAYLIYKNSVHPSYEHGLKKGDRLLWLNGEYLFSNEQLSHLLNENTVFVTAERDGRIFHSKLPKAKLDELKLSRWEKAEFDDWKHEANISSSVQDLYFLPYVTDVNNRVLSRVSFIDPEDQKKAFLVCERCPYFHPLERGDHILAVDGIQVKNSFDLLSHLQKQRALMIVQRDPQMKEKVLWTDADKQFDDKFEVREVEKMVAMLGTSGSMDQLGSYTFLKPFEPPVLKDVAKHIPDFEVNEENQSLHVLGSLFDDKVIQYNPNPFTMFKDVIVMMYGNLTALITGTIPAKFMSGPVGIIQVVQYSWMQGVKEALFWLGLISVNLAVLNLLPIPVLDGGYITISIYEWITKKRLSAKAMKQLIVPFMILLIGFLLYVTYHDVMRLFKGFF
jgi:regulator of sigma E protease